MAVPLSNHSGWLNTCTIYTPQKYNLAHFFIEWFFNKEVSEQRHKLTDEKEHRSDNITYTQAGVSCFVGQESAKFKVQFFVGKFSGKNPCLRIAEKRYTLVANCAGNSGT